MNYSPYVDVLLWPTLDIFQLPLNTKSFTLAFITADSTGNPSWGSQISLSQNHFKDILAKCKDPKITISFGGALGIELACFDGNSVEMLLGHYKAVLEAYPMVIGFDFDIEGAAVSNTIANDKRAKALVMLQRIHPNLQISFTLLVMPTGLLQNSLDLLSNARDSSLRLDHVNLMVMDYGLGCKNMSAAGIQAYESVFRIRKH
jgi:hypothetical protein